MPKGMRRSVIVSHGRVHDEAGVKGTYMKGTVPAAKVAQAIPPQQHAVEEITEPGDADAPPPPRKPFIYDPVEGQFLPASRRPELEVDDRSPEEKKKAEELDKFIEEAEAKAKAEAEETEEAQVPAEDEPVRLSPPPAPPPPPRTADEASSVELPTSQRKVKRAKHSKLMQWCRHLGIDLETCENEEGNITARNMRQAVIDHLEL